MKQWHENLKTTLLKEMQQGRVSPLNNVNTADETEATLNLLIGQALTQTSLLCAYADFLRRASQFNSLTPVTVEALSFALWAMESHLTSTLDQAKTSMDICKHSQMTTQKLDALDDTIAACELIMEDVNLFFFG